MNGRERNEKDAQAQVVAGAEGGAHAGKVRGCARRGTYLLRGVAPDGWAWGPRFGHATHVSRS